jgi:hypothetical protein
MRKSRAVRTGVAAVLCAVAVTACGGGPAGPAPEITTGTAPTGQQPVSLQQYPAQSVGNGDEWPRACQLLTPAEVQAVLPQATEVELTGGSGGFDYKLVGLGTYETPYTSNPYGQSRSIDIPEQKCEARMRLPSDADEDDVGVHASFAVTVDMVGSKDTVDYFWSASGDQPMADSFGAEECRAQDITPDVPNVATFHCRKGEMSIEVVGILSGLDNDRHPEDVPHVRLAGQPVNTPPDQAFEWFRSQVVPQVVGVAARRMP